MTLALTDDQIQIQQLIQRYCTEHPTQAELLAALDGHPTAMRERWNELTAQLGLPALGVAEEFGGMGMGMREHVLVLEQLGYTLLPSPYLGTCVVAARVLTASNADVRKRYLPRIAAGELVVGLALAGEAGTWSGPHTTRAVEVSGGWRASGTASFVLDGSDANLFLIAADTECGSGLFLVDGDAPGLVVEPMETMDSSRDMARVVLGETPATCLATGEEFAALHDLAVVAGSVGLAAEQLGSARACLDMAVQYSRTRVQFGRQIGSFQAIQHKCADLLLDTDCGWSAVIAAAEAVENAAEAARAEAALTQAFASEIAVRSATENIQIHGGIGFTWEHPAHLYYRRSISDAALIGSATWHREKLAGILLDSSPTGSTT